MEYQNIDEELLTMIKEYRMDSMGDILMFKEWQKEDGSKEGLLRLILTQDPYYVIPSNRNEEQR